MYIELVEKVELLAFFLMNYMPFLALEVRHLLFCLKVALLMQQVFKMRLPVSTCKQNKCNVVIYMIYIYFCTNTINLSFNFTL